MPDDAERPVRLLVAELRADLDADQPHRHPNIAAVYAAIVRTFYSAY